MKTLPAKLLLVEDDDMLAARIQLSLSTLRRPLFQVIRSKNIADATTQLNRRYFDLVLLDISVGSSQGLTSFETLQALAPRALFILLCAGDDEHIARQAMNLGASDYLDKTHIDRDLLARVLDYNLTSKLTKNVLRVSIAGLVAIGEASPLGIMVSDLAGFITYTNRAYRTITGFSAGQLLGQPWADAIHPRDRLRVQREWRHVLKTQGPFNTQARMLHKDQSTRWVKVNGALLLDEKDLHGHVRIVEDITAQVLQVQDDGQRIPPEAQRFALSQMHEAILVTDENSRVTYLNAVAQQITGWHSAAALGQRVGKIFNVRDEYSGNLVDDAAQLAMTTNQTVILANNGVLTRRDGSDTLIENVAAPLHNKVGQVCGAVLMFRDASQSYSCSAQKVDTPLHNAISGLPNGQLLKERLRQAIRQASTQQQRLAILHVRISAAPPIHGDDMECAFSAAVISRIDAALRENDSLYQLNEGEFVIMFPNIGQPANMADVLSNLRNKLSLPYCVYERKTPVTLRSGVSVYPNDSSSWEELLSLAASAMKRGKTGDRTHCHFYEDVSRY